MVHNASTLDFFWFDFQDNSLNDQEELDFHQTLVNAFGQVDVFGRAFANDNKYLVGIRVDLRNDTDEEIISRVHLHSPSITDFDVSRIQIPQND